MLVRFHSLSEKMPQFIVHQVNETGNIGVWLNAVVTEVNGDNRLENITI